jgi:hypothetical protein
MRKVALTVLVLAVAACGADAPQEAGGSDTPTGSASPLAETVATSPSIPAPTTSAPPATISEPAPTSEGATTTIAEPSEQELAVFIATIEELLVGTVYEGEAINEPELFLATGWLFCDWLDEGSDTDAVFARYLDGLAGGVEEASDDQLVLTGALYGAAVSVLCPHHTQSLG